MIIYYPANEADSSFLIEWYFCVMYEGDIIPPFVEKYRNAIYLKSYGGFSHVYHFEEANVKLEDFLEEARKCAAHIEENYDGEGTIRFEFPSVE